MFSDSEEIRRCLRRGILGDATDVLAIADINDPRVNNVTLKTMKSKRS
jgi:hypothetical protein